MIRLMVADDQAMIRTALATMLDLETDLKVVATAGSCGEAFAQATATRPDVVLLDVQMPNGGLAVEDGIETIPLIRRAVPHAAIVILTTFGRPGYLRRAMEAGAVGFMVKDAPADRLVEGVRRAAAGLRVVDADLAVASLSIGESPLTQKETEVLAAAARGAVTTAQIASQVYLSEGTVRNYLSNAISKLGAVNRAEAIRRATENGWL